MTRPYIGQLGHKAVEHGGGLLHNAPMLTIENQRIKLRAYQPKDKDSCLALFESNQPKYFLIHEKRDFQAFLDKFPLHYYVAENKDRAVVACGGYTVKGETEAHLCWGMVDLQYHGLGIGRLLLLARMFLIARVPEINIILMDTSQNSEKFFAKEGFATYQVTPEFYGPELHRHDMRLELDEKTRESIRNRVMDPLAQAFLADFM